MSNLVQCQLGEVIAFGNGKSRPAVEGKIPVYGGNGIMGYANTHNYSLETIVIGRVGAYCGATYYASQPIWVSDNALAAKPRNKNNAKYLFYFLRHLDLNQHAQGSSHPLVTQTLLNSIDVEIVGDPDEQRAIADVLSSLDDKIDLLHRQNKTLEALAETLFRQWFVEEAESPSPTQLELGQLIETVSRTHKLSDPTIVFLNTSDIYLGNVLKHGHESVKDLPGQAKKSICQDDILFSEIRPANGRFAYINFDSSQYVVSTKLMVLRSKGIVSQPFVYFYLTHPMTIEWLQTLAEARSGTFPQITFDQIKTLKVNIPSDKMLNTAMRLSESWLHKIKFNHGQIRTLEKLRDTLLPKLMSGEARVQH